MPRRAGPPQCITIKEPMVLIPADQYRALLEEAGYVPTPKLDREIAQARANFRKGKTIPWRTLKHELSQLQD